MKERIDNLLHKQHEFFNTQETRSVEFRLKALKKLKSIISEREKDIHQALYKDFKKSEFESVLSETGIVNAELNRVIKNLKSWARPKRVRASLLNFPSSDYIYKDPYGTVLIIAPWNYPYQLAMVPLIGAISGGNTAFLKPSELTPCTSELIQEIVAAIFDEEYVAVMQGGVSIAQELLSKRWDYIFFTGSVPVGKIVAKAAAEYLTPVTLELGGKSPCIVDETVNLKLVTKRLVWGKFLNGGQTCIAPDYVIIKDEIKESFIKQMKEEIKLAYGNDPKQSNDYPRIINNKNFNRLKELLKEVTIVVGGETDENDLYISPTIIDEPSLESQVMKDEIFGPILPILTYKTVQDIDNILSHFEKPLSFYVFSKNKSFIKFFLRKYSFGGGTINDTMIHYGNHKLPFGGVGNSGIGGYHGKHTFETFTHSKSIIRKSNWIDVPVRYAPYKGKLKYLKMFFKYFS